MRFLSVCKCVLDVHVTVAEESIPAENGHRNKMGNVDPITNNALLHIHRGLHITVN